jgi:hypothetical protein
MTRLAALSLVAIGCVARGDEVPIEEPDPASFTRAEARAAGNALAAGLEDAAAAYGPIALGATVAPDCVSSTGDSSDTDNDTIPVDATLSYDCTAKRLGYTGVLTGTQAVVDDDPGALAWAFTAGTQLHAALTGPFGGSMVTDSSGSIVASQRTVAGPFDLTRALDLTTVITNVRGVRIEVSETVDWIVTYTPNIEWSPGGFAVTGAIAADGTWAFAVDTHHAAATLSTPTPLQLTPDCDSRITAGVVRAAFATELGEASISVEWSGCGRSTVSFEPSI